MDRPDNIGEYSTIVMTVLDVLTITAFIMISLQFRKYTKGAGNDDDGIHALRYMIAIFVLCALNGYFWHLVALLTGQLWIEHIRMITMFPLVYFSWRFVDENKVYTMIASMKSRLSFKDRNYELDG